ncbi:MAG: formyltransferase family protein [Dehalococcoidia bacterium]|jgi:folate-dependent phosphoribosylglycinamide formyltransferase PurN|nr:formyltransferase family protein [Dehalococcoidia bacterium]MDP7513495.1 formyltransferase family protein [Dehalococcoidia bacterium]
MTSADRSPLKLGWFSTGRGEGSRGLLTAALDAIHSGSLNARIEFVFVNRERGQHTGTDRYMDLVEQRGIPLVNLSSQRFRSDNGRAPWSELRGKFDEAVMELLKPYSVDVSVTAGYMLIAPILCLHYIMVNLHPALPGGPIGMIDQVIWELIRNRADESGVMIHVVTEALDLGPVVAYCRFPLSGPGYEGAWSEIDGHTNEELRADPGEDLGLFQAIRTSGVERERPLLVATLAAIGDGRIDLNAAGSADALDLTDEIEPGLARS